jgi:hypothetical protein
MATQLPDSGPREELHFRNIEMRGYRRADGLYEIEGRVVDRKPFDFTPPSGGRLIPANHAIHDMGVRLVIDDDMLVHDAIAFTAASPYPVCPEAGASLAAVRGLRIVAGWSSEVKRLLGGSRSCTHLMELLIPLGTAAFQSLVSVRRARPEVLRASGRPAKIDSCYAYGSQRELVRQHWPQFYDGPPAD